MIEFRSGLELKYAIRTWLERTLKEIQEYETFEGYEVEVTPLTNLEFRITASRMNDKMEKEERYFDVRVKEWKPK